MGGIEFGKCEICGKETQLERTYFYSVNLSNNIRFDIVPTHLRVGIKHFN